MDEGLPIAYEVLEKNVPVLSCDGQQVGTVEHVVVAPEHPLVGKLGKSAEVRAYVEPLL